MKKEYKPECGNGTHSSHHSPKEIVNFLNRFGLVLNVGCGVGSLSMIGDSSLEIVNIDSDMGSLSVLRNKNANITTICADAQHLPFKSERFDSVLVIEVLEHLPTPELCIREVHRVLKQKGSAIFTTPVLNIPFPCLVSIYRKMCGLQRANIEHLHVFSTSKLRNMLNKHFIIVDISHRAFANNLLEKIFGAVWTSVMSTFKCRIKAR